MCVHDVVMLCTYMYVLSIRQIGMHEPFKRFAGIFAGKKKTAETKKETVF